MHLEEIISSCNQAISIQIANGVRPSLRRAADVDPRLLDHVCNCLECLFAVMDPGTSLVKGGCEEFQSIVGEDGLLPLDSSTSPLAFAHVNDEMIEEYCFGRLTDLDRRGLEGHLTLCMNCAERTEGQRQFVAVMKCALDITTAPAPAHIERKSQPARALAMSAGG